jgi:DNA polymerase-3 subunit delta'
MAEIVFAVPGQPEAERLLNLAAEHPKHAYLLHGPPGSGMDEAVRELAAALLGDRHRVEDEIHPDLYVLEPEGEEIRIEQVGELLHDLAMRPFEGQRRVYVVREAERLNRDAANAFLKSLEEPPPYAHFLLLTHERARVLPTVQSRCQPVRFRRLPADDVAGVLEAEGLAAGAEARQAARSAAGNLDGARRLAADPGARAWRDELLGFVYGVLSRDDVDPGDAAGAVLVRVAARGRAEEERLEAERDRALELLGTGPAAKKEEKRVRDHYKALIPRRRRRAELQELRATLDVIETALRDLLCASLGADAAIVERGRLPQIEEVAVVLGNARATAGLAAVRHTRETLLLPVDRTLAMQALWHRLSSLRPADREARTRP